MPSEYDQNLLNDAPEVSTSQRQEGYTLDLLNDQGRRSTPAPRPSRTPAPTNPAVGSGNGRGTPVSNEGGYGSKPEIDAEVAGFKSSTQRVPFYRTTKGIIIIALATVAVIAIAVGAGVGAGTKKKNKGNPTDVSGTTPTTPSSGGSSTDSGGENGPSSSASRSGLTPQTPQTPPPNPSPSGGGDNGLVVPIAGALSIPKAYGGDTLD
jgi:hypothetical protein